MTDQKKPEIEFAPGCFDNFEGTQEELEALQKEIIAMFETMTLEELKEQSRPVDIDQLIEQEPEVAAKIAAALTDEPRKLH